MSSTTYLAFGALALLCSCGTAVGGDPALSVCKPITAAAAHRLSPAGEDPFPVHQRLALIENGTVPCVDWDGLETTRCAFRTDRVSARASVSGDWLEDKHGRRFAPVGQPLGKDGARGGPYVVATQLVGNAVPCVAASG
jgi:hypothetical protein